MPGEWTIHRPDRPKRDWRDRLCDIAFWVAAAGIIALLVVLAAVLNFGVFWVKAQILAGAFK